MSEDADALFLAMPDPAGESYQPMLAFETRGLMTMVVPGTSESIDPRISTFLEGGFEMLSGEEWRFPMLDGWQIQIDEGADLFSLVDPAGLPAYSVPLSEVTPEWLVAMKHQGQCVVITGTGLGLDLTTFSFDNVSAAASRGTVVGAVVSMGPTDDERGASRLARWLRGGRSS